MDDLKPWYDKIARTPQGTYRAAYTFPGSNERHRESLRTTDREAAARKVRDAWAIFEHETRQAAFLSAGLIQPDQVKKRNEMPLRFACAKWMEEHGGDLPSNGNYASCHRAFIAIIGGDTLLSAIDTEAVAKLVRYLKTLTVHRRNGEQPFSPGRINGYAQHLRAVMRRARRHWSVVCDWEAIHWTGEDGVLLSVPKFKRTVIRTHADESEIVAALDADTRPVFRFCVLSGMRQNNALTLKKSQIEWDDASMASGKITVRLKSRKRDHRTGESARIETYSITPGMAAILKAEWPNHPTHVFSSVCRKAHHAKFVGKRGKAISQSREVGARYPFTPQILDDRWNEARASLGLKMRWHDATRASFANRLKAMGWHIEDIQKAMRHSNIATTQLYLDVDDDRVDEMLKQTEQAWAASERRGKLRVVGG